MITPFFKNIHTLSIKFTKGTRNYKDVIKLLRDHLGIQTSIILIIILILIPIQLTRF